MTLYQIQQISKQRVFWESFSLFHKIDRQDLSKSNIYVPNKKINGAKMGKTIKNVDKAKLWLEI